MLKRKIYQKLLVWKKQKQQECLLVKGARQIGKTYIIDYFGSLMIFQKFGNMKFAYRNRKFWCKGYYVDTVGKNTAAIKNYIANQLKVDKESDQLSIFDPRDPFTGSK